MELTVDQALQHGVAAHKAGKLQDAERLYRGILHAQPKHPDANHNLGLVAVAVGKPLEAIPFFKLALETNSKIEQFWLSYIDVLITLERVDEAQRLLVESEKTGVFSDKLDALKQRLKESMPNDRRKIVKAQTLTEKRNAQGSPLSAGPSPDQINHLIENYKAGRLEEAQTLATSLTQQFPKHPFAWKALGAAFKKMGRLVEALAPMKSAVRLSLQDSEAHNNLGITLQELGRLDEAEASLRQAIALRPDYPEAHNNLGVTLKELGKLGEAETNCRQAIALKSDYAEAFYNLGNTLRELGRLNEAEASYKKATALEPDYGKAHNNLGSTLKELGRLNEAEASYKKAIALKPDYAKAHSNLGNALKEAGRVEEAEASYGQAIALKPDYADAYCNLGITLQELGRLDEAEAGYRQAIALKPDFAEAYNNLGNTFKELGRLGEAEASYRHAITLQPDYAKAHSNLLMLISSMLFNKARYHDSAAGFAIAAEDTVTSRFDTWSHNQDEESLRIGFVSGDLRSHPVGYFIEGLLTQLQPSLIELFAYPTVNTEEELTRRLRACFHEWSPLVGLNDKDAAQKIHSDGIHVLIDLSGHTAKNRTPVFAWKPAPIQVSWLGYFASTGLPEMNYILGDPYVTPHKEADHFVEKIWQLPETYLCFTPPDLDLEVAPLPAYTNGFVTFGCFNNLARMTDEIVSVRASILHAVPGSKLFLKDKQLDHESGRNQVLSRFAAVNIGAERLILEGRSPREEYLKCYGRVDIALSPFPYGGGTTSVEGLWMGVPVITKKGNHFLSHLGESIAYNSGLSDWIASDKAEYVAKAVAYASNLEALSDLRKGMRECILSTPLFDVPRFALHFEQAIRAMREEIK